MTGDYSAPPAPDGSLSGTFRRADFRPTPPARRRRRFPRWLAILLVAGVVVIVGGVAAQLALTARSSGLEPAQPGALGRLNSIQVVSGMCLLEIGNQPGDVFAVACSERHEAEVVSSYNLTGDDWPGEAAVATSVLNYCASQLAPGGPLEAASAGRAWVAWVPSEDTWNTGDRKGLCIVTAGTAWTGKAVDE